MAKERSDKCPYESKFGGGWLNSVQFLAESMCARAARAQKTELPHKFWNDTYWLKKYKLQLKHAANLLKDFTVGEIIKGLKHQDARRIYSLGLTSVLVPLIEREKKLARIREENNQVNRVEESADDYDTSPANASGAENEIVQPRKPFSLGKNKLQKLRELDG
jgi:hypothetical protein